MLRLALLIYCVLLIAACGSGAVVSDSICRLAESEESHVPAEGVRITAVFVPNSPHRPYFTDPDCPSVIVRATFPDRSRFEDFFDSAYAGGGLANRLEVDVTVTADLQSDGTGRGLVLKIEQVHEFTDVSVTRPPRPQ